MKRVLDRQIQKYFKDIDPQILSHLQPFFDEVLEVYEWFEKDRILMDRSLDLSSRELMEKNEKLLEKSETVNAMLWDMMKSVQELDNTKKHEFHDMELTDLSVYLRELIRSVKKSKIEAIKQKNYLFTIVDSIWEGLMVVNHEWKIVMFNKMSQNLTGYTNTQVINRHYRKFDFFHNEKTRDEYEDFIWKTMTEHTMEFISDNILLKNVHGHYTSVSVITSPMWELSSDDMWCVIVFRDTSKEKELERMKDEFVSIASHELRTPMTVINGYAGLLLWEKMWPLRQQQKEYMSKIKWNTIQLINLVNDMLSLSRAESWKLKIHKDSYDIWSQMRDVTSWFRYIFTEKWLSLKYEYVQQDICSDAGKIEEILTNLIWNALKFTPKWWKVTVSHRVKEDFLEVSINDTWEWISSENIGKLFQKFSQVNSHLHNKAEWTRLFLQLHNLIL